MYHLEHLELRHSSTSLQPKAGWGRISRWRMGFWMAPSYPALLPEVNRIKLPSLKTLKLLGNDWKDVNDANDFDEFKERWKGSSMVLVNNAN